MLHIYYILDIYYILHIYYIVDMYYILHIYIYIYIYRLGKRSPLITPSCLKKDQIKRKRHPSLLNSATAKAGATPPS